MDTHKLNINPSKTISSVVDTETGYERGRALLKSSFADNGFVIYSSRCSKEAIKMCS